MGMSRWRRCRASAVGDVARASCPLGRGRPARAHRHARDGDGAKSVASGAANHPAAGRGHSLASVIDAIEIKDEEKLGRPGNHLGTGRARSPVSVIDRTEIKDEERRGRALLGPTPGVSTRTQRHGRDGHDTKSVAPGRSHHPVPGRAQSPASVIDRIEIKGEEKLGRALTELPPPGPAAHTSPHRLSEGWRLKMRENRAERCSALHPRDRLTAWLRARKRG